MNGDKEKTKSNPSAEAGKEKVLTTAAEGMEDQMEESTANHSTGTDNLTNAVDQPQPASSMKSQSQKTKGAGLFIVLLLFILAATGGLAWYGWTYHIQPQQQQLQMLEQSVNRQLELSNRLNDRQQSADKVRATTEKLLANLSSDQKLIEQRLEVQADRLRDLSGTNRDDWMLAEAKYLLRLASQRLLMERGTVGALALLESADEILTAIDNVDLFIVRDAVAKDIMALKLAPTVDREGIYLQLAALIDALKKLPPIPPPSLHQLTPSAEKAEPVQIVESEKKWYSLLLFELQDTFVNLGEFIKVHHYDQPPEPLLSDEYQYYLIHNLRLMFEQAQSALLREQPQVYRQSLEQARQWLNQYYVHYPEKNILVGEINRLQQQPVVQLLPDISGSLKQLTNYIDRYHKLTPEKGAVEAGEHEAVNERPMMPAQGAIESKSVPPMSQDAMSSDKKGNN